MPDLNVSNQTAIQGKRRYQAIGSIIAGLLPFLPPAPFTDDDDTITVFA